MLAQADQRSCAPSLELFKARQPGQPRWEETLPMQAVGNGWALRLLPTQTIILLTTRNAKLKTKTRSPLHKLLIFEKLPISCAEPPTVSYLAACQLPTETAPAESVLTAPLLVILFLLHYQLLAFSALSLPVRIKITKKCL